MQAFYRKLFWVWLSQLGKLFYNDPTTIVEVTHVDETNHSVFFFFLRFWVLVFVQQKQELSVREMKEEEEPWDGVGLDLLKWDGCFFCLDVISLFSIMCKIW